MFGNRKVYGASRLEKCPFCEKTALTKNAQGIPVCLDHKHKEIGNLKCSCGKWLDLKSGKFGSYFNCINCGNISFNKAIDMNPKIEPDKKQTQAKPLYKTEKEDKPKKEITIRSDELDFYY